MKTKLFYAGALAAFFVAIAPIVAPAFAQTPTPDAVQAKSRRGSRKRRLTMLNKFVGQIILVVMILLSQFLAPTAHAAPLFQRPSNDNFSNALGITGPSGTVRGSNVGATKENWEGWHADNIGGASVWYRWTAPASGAVRFDTTGSNFDTLLAIYLWPDRTQPLVPIVNNDDGQAGTTTSLVMFNAEAGAEYHIVVDGFGGATGAIQLAWLMPNVASPSVRVRAPQPNDNLANAQEIEGGSGSVHGSNLGASKESWEGQHAGKTGGASVWYRWVSPVNGTIIFDTYGSHLDTLLAGYTRLNQTGALVGIGSNDDANSEGESRVLLNVNAGVEYLIAVDGYGGATGNFTLNWAVDQTSPVTTVDLAITDLHLSSQPRGTLYARITNNGPATLTNQSVTISCDAMIQCKAGPGERCIQSIRREQSQRTISLILRPGQTNQYSTNMPIDTTENSYPEVTCRLQGDYHDPRSSNNAYTTTFR